MNKAGIGVASLLLLMLPGSCIAAPAPPPKPKPKPAQFAAPTTPIPPKPAPIGKFLLSRAPQQGSITIGQAPAGTERLVVDGQTVPLAADGRFLIGFDRDYAATTLITAFQPGGDAISEKLPVAKRAWKIESLATLPHHSQPDAEFARRRPGELAQINAARRKDNQSDGWQQPFIWPAKGRISGFFGSQRIYAGEPGSPHGGVDVAGGVGARVVAPANGVVILAAPSPFTLEGNLLMIDHGMGLNSAFLHLSRIDVRVGDRVSQGQPIGAIGQTGRATGPHLHWGLRWHSEKIDPQPLAGPMLP
ncbi:MAG: M23 family metallopeptidase [Sphingomonadaceae bacterium]